MPMFTSIQVFEFDYKSKGEQPWLVIDAGVVMHNTKPLPSRGYCKITYDNGTFEWSAPFTIDGMKMKPLETGKEIPFDEMYDKEAFQKLVQRGQLTIKRPYTHEPLFRFILDKRNTPDIRFFNENSKELYVYDLETLKPVKPSSE